MTFEEYLQIQIHDGNNINNIGAFNKKRLYYQKYFESLNKEVN